MDLSSEFHVHHPSQDIDSYSEDEDLSQFKSPVFKRNKTPQSSPILSTRHKARKLSQQMNPVRRSLGEAFREESLGTKTSCPAAWPEILPSSSPECQVSSCDSTELRPQPVGRPASHPAASATSYWLAGLQQELAGQDEEQLDSEEESPAAAMVNSDKKRKKPVKGGFAEQLERCLQQAKSRTSLENYQLDKQKLPQLGRQEEVSHVRRELDLVLLQCGPGLLVLNTELVDNLKPGPQPGDKLAFNPALTTSLGDREVWLGVSALNILSSNNNQVGVGAEEPEKPLVQSVRCPCLQNINLACRAVPPPAPAWPASPAPALSPPDSSDSPSFSPVSPVVRVRQLVERAGGLSSSPNPSPPLYRPAPVLLQLTLHRVFLRQAGPEEDTEPALSLLCEDAAGEFVLVRQDGRLRGEPGWAAVWPGSLALLPATISLSSPLHLQARLTRNTSANLFSVIRAVRQTDQRYCYVLKAFHGSKLEVQQREGEGSVEAPQFTRLTDPAPQGSRVNCTVRLLLVEPGGAAVHVQVNGDDVVRVRVAAPASLHLLRGVSLPVLADLLGLLVDGVSDHVVDSFTQLLPPRPCGEPSPLAGLPQFGPDSRAGQLVSLAGLVVVRVSRSGSEQWLECPQCGEEQVEQVGTVWECGSCRDQFPRPDLRLTLTCCTDSVAGCWVRLTTAAAALLPPALNTVTTLHPGDVIGQRLPTGLLALVDQDGVAVECDTQVTF